MEKEKEKMLELLADQTLFGLNAEEKAELENLQNRFAEFKTDDSFELAAAAIYLADLEIENELPLHLQTKLEAQSREFFNAEAERISASKQQPENSLSNENPRKIYEIPERRRPIWQWLGLAAAAACVILAIGFLLTRPKTPEVADQTKPAPTANTAKSPEIVQLPANTKTPEPPGSLEPVKTPEPEKTPELAKNPKTNATPETVKTPEIAKNPSTAKTPAVALTAAQKREQLLTSAPDIIQTSWTAAKGDKKVLGDVVWSNAEQKGYLRLRDLPALDASRETYQLWIVDEQHEKTPISGGMFNVSSAGEIIIPINAQIKVGTPKQFAITKEKAGGVVVSKPDRVVAVAKV